MSRVSSINLLIEIIMVGLMTFNLIYHNTDGLLYGGFMFIWLTMRHIDTEK